MFMKMNLKSMKWRAWARCGAVLSILSIALVANAQFDYSETSTYFGNWGQGNAAINVQNALNIQPNACAPTAVLNGLIFLENEQTKGLGQRDPFATSQNTGSYINNLATKMQTSDNNIAYFKNAAGTVYTIMNPVNVYTPGLYYPVGPGGTLLKATGTVNNVGGTSEANLDSGLRQYLNLPQANPSPLPYVYVYQADDPSAGALGAVLKNDDAVELGLSWGTINAAGNFVATGGGHIVTLQSLDMTSATKGSATLIDPWGTTTGTVGPGAAAQDVSVSVTVQNGGLVISGIFGGDADLVGNLYGGPGTSLTAFVSFEEVESVTDKTLPAPLPVPEPSTYLAGALLLIPLGVSSLRKLRAARLTA